MLNAYTNTSQSISAGSPIPFNTNRYRTCKCISHSAGSTSITLNCPGYYIISFSGTATATTSGTDPIIVQLARNGTAVPAGNASALSAAANTPVSLSFTTAVKVLSSCCAVDNTTVLSVLNSGIAADFTNVEIVVKKVCQ